MTTKTARERLQELAGHLPPMYGLLAQTLIAQASDAQASEIVTALDDLITQAQAGDTAGALAKLQQQYPEVAPYLAAFDLRGMIDEAVANSRN